MIGSSGVSTPPFVVRTSKSRPGPPAHQLFHLALPATAVSLIRALMITRAAYTIPHPPAERHPPEAPGRGLRTAPGIPAPGPSPPERLDMFRPRSGFAFLRARASKSCVVGLSACLALITPLSPRGAALSQLSYCPLSPPLHILSFVPTSAYLCWHSAPAAFSALAVASAHGLQLVSRPLSVIPSLLKHVVKSQDQAPLQLHPPLDLHKLLHPPLLKPLHLPLLLPLPPLLLLL